MRDQFLQDPGTQILVIGNEAIARGAIEAGVQVVTAYPGTPSSEVVETLLDLKDDFGYYAEWSINEKVAFEIAAGASLVGARSITVMKGAGLNWAMDTFMTLPLTGVRGGMVIIVADDPGAHYSSNEQDSRLAAQWAGLVCLEPSNHQEAKELTKLAFSLSEQLEQPVFIRSVTRLSHASGVVKFGPLEKGGIPIGFNKNWKIPFRWNVYGLPGLVEKHDWQMNQVYKARAWAEECSLNSLFLQKSKTGIVAVGIGASYAKEVLHELGIDEQVNYWKVTTVYPMPEGQARKLLEACNQILVVEEGSPVFENQLRILAQDAGINVKIYGKSFSDPFPQTGELTTDRVYEAVAGILSLKPTVDLRMFDEEVGKIVIPRSSALCAGCPHLGTYWGIENGIPQNAKVVPIINGDIGCYEQAGYGIKGRIPAANDRASQRVKSMSVYNMLDTLYVMGSGLSMAQGEVRAGYQDGPIVAVAGDSTFFHATIPALINALWNKTKLTFIILDNSWTAMTGHQPSPVTCTNEWKSQIKIENVVQGLGVPFIRIVDSFNVEEVANAVREAVEFEGVSVIISRGECTLQIYRKISTAGMTKVNQDLCNGCKQCIIMGCPAIIFHNRKANIDPLLCVNCKICIKVCPENAISEEV